MLPGEADFSDSSASLKRDCLAPLALSSENLHLWKNVENIFTGKASGKYRDWDISPQRYNAIQLNVFFGGKYWYMYTYIHETGTTHVCMYMYMYTSRVQTIYRNFTSNQRTKIYPFHGRKFSCFGIWHDVAHSWSDPRKSRTQYDKRIVTECRAIRSCLCDESEVPSIIRSKVLDSVILQWCVPSRNLLLWQYLNKHFCHVTVYKAKQNDRLHFLCYRVYMYSPRMVIFHV